MQTLRVNLTPKTKSYSIFISEWNLNHSVMLIKKTLKEKRLFIITNNTIKKLYHSKIEKIFGKHFQTNWISIADGEQYKNLTTYEKILTELSEKNAGRHSMLLALGGGVVGDMTGFVAATYMRGIDWFQMPTTLLAQVDASVGGKTGVDLKTGKNLVGAFHQPKAVFIHTHFLNTLSKRDFQCGMAEIIKYALIWDKKLFALLTRHSRDILNLKREYLEKIVFRSCQIKAEVVRRDERENSLRAILNFGHTLGHAIEVLNKFKKINHGEAVAMGMVYATKLSHKLNHSEKDFSSDVVHLLELYHLPTNWPKFNKNHYERVIQKDKKANTTNIKFILLQKIGKVHIVPLQTKEVLKCL